MGSEVREGEKVFTGHITDIKSQQPPSRFHHPLSFQEKLGVRCVSGG